MMQKPIHFLLFAVTALFLVSNLEGRTWKNSAGVEIEAELSGVDGAMALLQKDGQIFRVPIASLSEADQAFIQSWKPEAPIRSTAEKEDEPETRKKGFCLSQTKFPDWPEKLKTLGVGWFYSWKPEKPEQVPEGIEYVPMVFGKEGRIESSVEHIEGAKSDAGFRFVLGYNEPDKADQSNMSVEAALADWPKLMSIELPLISPAAAQAEGEWMEEFMDGIDEAGHRVDYIAIHSYGGSNPNAFLDMLERVYRKFDRPLWITEFAVGDWNASNVSENRHSVDDIKNFMKKVLPRLDRLKYVYRYSWFSADPSDAHLGTSALFNEDGTLTELGEIYAKH